MILFSIRYEYFNYKNAFINKLNKSHNIDTEKRKNKNET